ncbi:Hsp20/alpha crystallin family protein [Methanobrevibacter curvatus]|uniref:Spore coat protein P n=1 Tax=Methanobrevibacter curvatus TaxID=49547 RepID=A0A162FL92_9EURY|nr:Hsp20/alpha crystallin family protein [Methanobrevibacter curvatus]KZX11710.1 spore coat protein P [Methanobrevibacter curvatus]
MVDESFGFNKQENKSNHEKIDEHIEKGKAIAGKVADDLGKTIDDIVVNLKSVQKDVDSKINEYKDSSISKIDVDVVNKDSVYYLVADLPGVKKEDIDIEISAKELTIKAFFNSICQNIKDECDGVSKGYDYLIKGRKFGKAERVINLPNKIKTEDIKAEFNNGSLILVLPQVEVEKVKINLD